MRIALYSNPHLFHCATRSRHEARGALFKCASISRHDAIDAATLRDHAIGACERIATATACVDSIADCRLQLMCGGFARASGARAKRARSNAVAPR
jgi:hypothetical protein